MEKHIKIVRDYNNLEQYKQFDNFDASTFQKKEAFVDKICHNIKIFDCFLNSLSFLNEFYVIAIKGNKLKADRLYIYVNGENDYTVDFISEWNDKVNKKVVRGIKKTIPSINLEGLRIVLRSLN